MYSKPLLMRQYYLTLVGLLCGIIVSGQDPSFSQFYAQRVYLNPAMTALEPGLAFSGIYRMQWRSVDEGFETFAASVEIQEPMLRSGFGLNIWRDVEGIMKLSTTSIGLSYAYTIPFEAQDLRIGLDARWLQKSVDWSAIVFSDEIDAVFGAIYPTSANPGFDRTTYLDFDMGINWRFQTDLNIGQMHLRNVHSHIGLALHHAPSLFSERSGNESLQGLVTQTPPRLTLHAGTYIPTFILANTKKHLAISPNIKFDWQGDNLLNASERLEVLTLGAYILYDGIYLGGFFQQKEALSEFKHTNAMILMVGVHLGDQRQSSNKYFIGFSYDANVTGVGPGAGGVYELAFRWNWTEAPGILGQWMDTSTQQSLDCYHFF